MKVINLFNDFINLFYPNQCVSCGDMLVQGENILCIHCLYALPKTNFHREPDNEVARIFWGRVPIQYATAFFYYQKGSRVQEILEKLKYRNQKEIGVGMGRIIGAELRNTVFDETEVIIPVPLHKVKYRQRGYNQSEQIALGLAASMHKPVDFKTLYRVIFNPTQTRKRRYDRWTNVEGIFALRNPQAIENKHILLVDDVITTGATLESCASTLLTANNVKVSIVTLAKA